MRRTVSVINCLLDQQTESTRTGVCTNERAGEARNDSIIARYRTRVHHHDASRTRPDAGGEGVKQAGRRPREVRSARERCRHQLAHHRNHTPPGAGHPALTKPS